MTPAYQPIFLGRRITIKTLRDYILDAGLADVDTIVMNQSDFDEIALQYKQTYKEHLPFPYLLLGVLIREEAKGVVRQGNVVVIENDTESLRVNPNDIFDPYRVIYRCHNCGSLVGPNGEELDRKEQKQNADYLNKFGNKVSIQHERGVCCDEVWKPTENPFKTDWPIVDYSAIEGKSLMLLTEEDFKLIGLSKGTTPGFEIIYSCRNARNSKIYFTPNESTYSLRGYRLEEYEVILSTEQLIEAVRKWRKD